jgi:hypothetical protein
MIAEVVFIGSHIYESRVVRDGYTIENKDIGSAKSGLIEGIHRSGQGSLYRFRDRTRWPCFTNKRSNQAPSDTGAVLPGKPFAGVFPNMPVKIPAAVCQHYVAIILAVLEVAHRHRFYPRWI